MASSMVTSASAPGAIVARATVAAPGAIIARATVAAPFTGLRTASAFPLSRKVQKSSNAGRIKCMKINATPANASGIWLGLKKFETLSYLPPLTPDSLTKEINYLLRKGWVPCIEFSVEEGFVTRENNRSPGYYDGRYWTMWKLPMFGCNDPAQVLREIEEAKKEYPEAFVRIIGFDNVRQVQCISFIVHVPPRAK